MTDQTTDTPAEAAVEPVMAETETPVGTIAVEVGDEPKPNGNRKGRGKATPAQAKTNIRTKTARKQPEASGTERNEEMATEPNTNTFAAFTAFPGAQAFEKLFADAAERSEEAVKRSRKAAEQLADISRANVDALVEASRIATSGAQSIGQQVLAKSRDNVDQAATAVRSLAEAKTPADVLQVQSDFVRGAFDRFVEESSTVTESLVKLAGEAFEPLTTRATLNAERFNELVA